jgi:SecD/SecF fusion protein
MTDRQRNTFILALVIGLIAASVVVIATKPTLLGLDLKGGIELVYKGEKTPQTPVVTPAALQRAVDVMDQRVNQLGVSEPSISTQGSDQIVVQLPAVQNFQQAKNLVGSTARLAFYDWEANVLTPSGKPAASLLSQQDQNAELISQGTAAAQPGSSAAGALTLFQAVKLASKQIPATAPECKAQNCSRAGPLYFAFGKSGSQACQIAARKYKVIPIVGTPCYLAGDSDSTSLSQLQGELPAGVSLSEAQVLQVPQGWVVLQGVPPVLNFSKLPGFTDTSPDFFVLRDRVALFGNEISNPQQSTDQSGNPDVSFGFSGNGANKFQSVTATIAKRGQLDSGLGQHLLQHFATALDTQLLTVPSIDYTQFPFGIAGNNGAEITGGFTLNSAQTLAQQLQLGALPIRLVLISSSQVSATLGKQALNKGLLAGLIGLILVVIFLLAYYRVLGLIAVAGLFVYGLYFFALIKVIPIVLTLPGIAGLILTIGVAADANIVIFERVKEEIRAGRSIRQGILTGYRKGLTAIVDANVVTILTAFILFVLATQEVQGFALTLGIGTFVSLFTAVMATQAILTTMGNARVISRPSFLGASGAKRVWRFDFMGASRYFFTMSGIILLVGALAIGARGLNLGIDFTSGTKIVAALNHPATQNQVSSVVSAAGASNPTVQAITNKGLGEHVFQISFKQTKGLAGIEGALRSHFGLRSTDVTSVGATFGSTVANSAVIAIIASLLVISAYVALRFEWKFAVPVLIALAHDLLITAGVYALLGREVTTATVAALLTILGYSMYDTIIVFDRVRENIPRMPRAAFSQIVNRSMSEVLTRSLATTFCTLMPIVALLLFGGVAGSTELQDFAFALMVGVLSGAYSSIFIASPVLMHWKEREHQYRSRRLRIIEEQGMVPAYATAAADVEPERKGARRSGRLTTPDPEGAVSAAEFEQMKRDLDIEREGGAHTSTLTKRLAHSTEEAPPAPSRRRRGRTGAAPAPAQRPAQKPAQKPAPPAQPAGDGAPTPQPQTDPTQPTAGDGQSVTPAPDIAENEGVAPVAPKPKRPSKPRNRRHGRRR